jgi:cysteine desulfurase
MTKTIYLDYAAATPVDPTVLAAMRPYFSETFYNPSADYQAARNVKKDLNIARNKIAYWLGSKENEIIFTAGGTEANNLAIRGVMQKYPKAKMLISPIEHDSIRLPAQEYLFAEIGIKDDGRIDLEDLKNKLNDSIVLVSVMYANNEIGVIEPLKKIAQVISSVRQDRKKRGVKLPLLFHSDACQAGNYLDLHVNRLGVDMMTLNGGKIYGPKQSGALFIKSGVQLKPLITGGGQEFNLRSGTENVAYAIGIAEALDLAQKQHLDESKRLGDIRDYFIARLEKEIKGVVVNGSKVYRLANNVHVSLADQDNEYLIISLDQLGIMASAGSACSAAKQESSHVLRALGLSDDQAKNSLRFSLGKTTTKQQIDTVIEGLKSIIKYSLS